MSTIQRVLWRHVSVGAGNSYAHRSHEMKPLRGARLRTVWWIRGLVLATALLVVATGFCFFDHGHDGTSRYAARADLCLGMLAVLLAMLPLVRPFAAGWAVNLSMALSHTRTRDIPDPPPKPSSLL